MYTVEFYETADGQSELWDFLEELRIKAPVKMLAFSTSKLAYTFNYCKITAPA